MARALICLLALFFVVAQAPVGPVYWPQLQARDPINIQDSPYNAQCDGVTDDTAAFQAALNAASSGQEVFISKPGTCLINSSITSPNSGIVIKGSGFNTILKRGVSLNAPFFQITGNNSIIRDLTIDGNTSNTVNQFADLALIGTSDTADHVQVLNSRGIGINLSGANDRATNSVIIGLNNASVQSYGIWAINHVQTIIDHNFVTLTGIDAIGADGNGTIINANQIVNAHCYTGGAGGQIAVYATSTDTGIVVSDNTVTGGCSNQAHGIEIDAVNSAVTGNTIRNAQRHGIAVDNLSANVLINGNVIVDSSQSTPNTWSGINVASNVNSFQIIGNRCIDDQGSPTQQWGVRVGNGSSDNYIISNNDLSGNVSGPLSDNGTGTHKNIIGNLPSTIVNTFASSPAVAVGPTLAGGPRASMWLPAPTYSTTTTVVPTAGRLYAAPVYVGSNNTVTNLAFNVTLTSGGSYRIGLYADAGTGFPGAVLYDSGVLSIGSTGVNSTGTISVASGGPGWIWAVIVFSSTSTPTVTAIPTSSVAIGQNSLYGSTGASGVFTPLYVTGLYSNGYSDTTVATALPGTFGASTLDQAQHPLLAVKF